MLFDITKSKLRVLFFIVVALLYSCSDEDVIDDSTNQDTIEEIDEEDEVNEEEEEEEEEEEDEVNEEEEEEEEENLQNFVWNQQGQKIEESSIFFFGGSIDFNNTGDKIIVGSSDSPNACSVFCDGLVRVYDFKNGAWTQINDDIYGDLFGNADFIGHDVAINGNGNFIVTSYQPSSNSVGHYITRVFQNINGAWVKVGQDFDNDASIGTSVTLNGEGNILAISMLKNNGNHFVRIYKIDNNEWKQIGEDIEGYANRVDLNYEGDVLAIGYSFGTGSVKLYDISENTWSFNERISGNSTNDRLSSGLDLSSDGNTVILGGSFQAGCNNCSKPPRIKVYEEEGSEWKQKGQEIIWEEEAYDINNEEAVAINGNGSRIAIGLKRIKKGSPTQVELFVLTFQYSDSKDEWLQMPTIHETGKIGGVWSLNMNDEGDIVAVGVDVSGRKSVEVFKLEPLP